MTGNVLLTIHNMYVYKDLMNVLNSQHFKDNTYVYLKALVDGFLVKKKDVQQSKLNLPKISQHKFDHATK